MNRLYADQLLSDEKLVGSSRENLIRLARYLNIHESENMTHKQLVAIVRWRVSCKPMLSKKQSSESIMLWDNLTV